MTEIKKQPFSILYVEDEESIRNNYIKYLSSYYENVYGAKNGEDAYAIYLKIKPQIMIIDINLPKMSGIELLSKIRKNDHTTRAIMLTAHTEVDILLQATPLKLTKYLVKPIKRGDLKDSLESAIQEISKFETKNRQQIYLKENYTYDLEKGELYSCGVLIEITNKEKILLNILMQNQNKISSYEELIYAVWDDHWNDKKLPLRTLIKNLRKKLPEYTIKNISAIGYKIEL